MYKCKSYRCSGCCVQQFCWKREVSKKKRDVLKGLWHKRERQEFTAKNLGSEFLSTIGRRQPSFFTKLISQWWRQSGKVLRAVYVLRDD